MLPLRLSILLLIVNSFTATGSFDEQGSLHIPHDSVNVDSLISLANQYGGVEKIDMLHRMVVDQWLNYPTKAMILGEQALELSLSLNDSSVISKSLRLIAGVYYYLGEYEQSLDYNIKALDIGLSLNDSSLINNGYNNIGLLNYNLGNYQTSLEYLLRSKEIKESIGETYGLATTLNNIGLVFERVGDYEEALYFFKKAYQAASGDSKRNNQLYSINNAGITYLGEGDLALALEHFHEGLKISNEIDNINWGSVSARGIAECLVIQGDLDAALHYINLSLDASTSINDKKGLAEIHYLLAKYHLAQSDGFAALKALKESDKWANQIRLSHQKIDNLKLYATIYSTLGRSDLESLYLNRLVNLRDSIFQIIASMNLSLVPLKLKEEQDRLTLSKQKAEIETRKIRNNIFLIILLIIFPLCIILVITGRKLRHANKKISKQSDEYRGSYETIKNLSEIGTTIISSLSVETIIERVYKHINVLIPADVFSLGLYDESKRSLIFYGDMEEGKKLGEHSYHLDVDRNRFAVKCYRDKKIILIDDVEADYPDSPKSIIGKETRSLLYIPLGFETKTNGILGVENFEAKVYNDYHLSVLSNLAIYVSIAIENSQTYRKLDLSYHKLQELDEFKESMTAMIVHDFKNSLNTVINFSEGKPSERRMKSIRQAGQFMLNMVMNILDVQKFEETSPKLSLANYPVSRLIKHAVEQLTYMMEQKSIKLEVNQDHAYEVRIDHDLMVRVIVNVLSNAIKYSPQNGQILIRVDKEEERVLVSIQDQGPGIPANMLEAIFDKYSQVEARKEGSARSTGLGLTFCKMVVEAHHGSIWAESTEKQGSRFYFALPIIQAPSDELQMETIDWRQDQDIRLEDQEREALKLHLDALSKLEVYDYSDVMEILNKIDSEEVNITSWKQMMLKALHNGNEELFKTLINQ